MPTKQKNSVMRAGGSLLSLAATAVLLSGGAEARVNVDVNVGVPAVVVPAVPVQPQVVLDVAPRFILSPALGFYVSVGIPYDIVYIGNSYYLNQGGHWYHGPYYNGPWKGVGPKRLPPGLRKHRFGEIRRYRDEEYRRFEHDRGHYGGKWHAPARHDNGRHGGQDRGNPGHGNGHHGGHGNGGGRGHH